MNNVNSLITKLYFHGKSYSSFKTLKLLKIKNYKKLLFLNVVKNLKMQSESDLGIPV